MKAACPRLFEVEALRDGRLTGVELMRFQSHLGVCGACAREARALQVLGEALAAPPSLAEPDELHVRRERVRLLAAFDASLVPAPRSSRARLWLGSAAAVVVLAALAFVLGPPRHASPSASRALAKSPEPVVIRADSSAKWSRRVENQLDKVVLESGALSIRVDHTASQRRLLVILPDGELEDIGTTFSVSADAGHTTRVTVQDGSVVLRLHGRPSLALGAGDSWSPQPALTTPIASSTPQPPMAATPTPSSVKPAPSASAAPTLDTPDLDASADFRAAMAAFDSGDNARAAARFASFLTEHARDAHAEDAAYLRVLALQRTGNSPATRQAAQDYLTRYPHGFRHAEVEALSR
jgi:TolA-binding protein